MADHHGNHLLLSALDIRDPEFPRKAVSLTFKIVREFQETLIATKKTIANSRELMAEADRILAKR